MLKWRSCIASRCISVHYALPRCAPRPSLSDLIQIQLSVHLRDAKRLQGLMAFQTFPPCRPTVLCCGARVQARAFTETIDLAMKRHHNFYPLK
eukprot:s352_g41.t1